MKIGITSDAYSRFGEERYKKMKADGYTHCDLNLADTETEVYNCSDERFISILLSERRLAEEAGIAFSQVHGPWRYPPKDGTEEERAERFEKLQKCIKATALLGCRYFVIHPIMPFGTSQNPDPEKLFNMNVEFFKKLLPTAKQNSVVICLENMPMKQLTVSTPTEILELVKAINDPYIKICLDTGHCAVFNNQPGNAVRELGGFIKTLHVHDNDGQSDEHRFPFTGIIDWKDFSAALNEIGFDGVLSLETTPDVKLNDDAYSAMNKELALIARQLADLAE